MRKKILHVLRHIGSWLCVFLFIIGLCELTLRIVPSEAQYPPLYEYGYKESLLGVEMLPNAVHTEARSCLTSTVTTNSLGWRDKERTIARVPGLTRIAVLGDSFMAGTQVNDDEVFARQLEKMLGEDKVEVLNFGLGSIGTEQEEILYEHVVSAYDPDIVLLALYSNDPMNSDPELEGGPTQATRLTFRDENGGLLSFRESAPLDGTRRWLRMHSALFRFVKLLDRFARQTTETVVTGTPPYPREFHVFDAPADAEWERAWGRVDRAVGSLKQRLSAPKRLVAFSAPEMLQTAPDPAALIRDQYRVEAPENFRPSYPSERFAQIATKHDVPFVDLLPVFIEEQYKRQLEYPYLYFTCDGHWNALGHKIAAETIASEIRTLIGWH